MRRMPERLPGLSADWRARLRQRLSRPGWRGADTRAVGPGGVERPAARKQPLRRVPRGLSGAYRHPPHAADTARERRGRRARTGLDPTRTPVVPDRCRPPVDVSRGWPRLGIRRAAAVETRMDHAAARPAGRLDPVARLSHDGRRFVPRPDAPP